MPKGIKKGTKRGSYKCSGLTPEKIAFVVKNSLKYTYQEMAKMIDIPAEKVLTYLLRNKIPRKYVDRKPPAKGSYTFTRKKNIVISNSSFDRSSFTKYSNKQSVA